MKLWEIVQGCNEGAYVSGDTFRNNYGQELFFNGLEILGIGNADIFSFWEYVEC